MDGPTLSRREQLILADIEEGLRADAELDRRMRTMRLHRWWNLWQLVRSEREIFGLLLLGSVSVVLVIGVPAARFAAIAVGTGLGLLMLTGLAAAVRPLVVSHRRAARQQPATRTGTLGEAA